MHRYPTSENSDLYEFKMALFYDGDQEDFLFAHIFKMTLKASGRLQDAAKIQYLCTLVRGEALHQFDMLMWNAGLLQLHMEPPPTPLIKSKHNDK